MTFVVVQFLDTDEVQIISELWLVNENVCKWPPYESRLQIKRALLQRIIPENSWNNREIFIMAVCDTYAKAKKELDTAVQSESDNEDKTPETKRQKLQTLLKTPQSAQGFIKNKIVYVNPNSPTETIFIPYESILSPPVHSNRVNRKLISSCSPSTSAVRNSTSNVLSDSVVNQPSLYSLPSQTKLVSSPDMLNSISIFKDSPSKNRNSCSVEGRKSLSPDHTAIPPVCKGSPPESKMCCSIAEAKLISLEKTMKSMEATVTTILNTVKELKEKLVLNTSVISGNDTSNVAPSSPTIFSRIKTIEEMRAFNDSLSNRTLFSDLVKFFGFMGGKDPSDATRIILNRLMSNDLAKEMNWKGNARKRSFQEFQSVIQLIAAAVRQNKLFKETTLSEVEGIIMTWLRYSSDRDGGRLRRRTKALTDAETGEA